MRIPLGSSAVLLVAIFEFMGILLSLFLVGLDLWIPVQMILVYLACSMRSTGAATTLVLCNAILGLDFTIFLVGFPTWPSALIGVAAIAVIISNFGSGNGAAIDEGSGSAELA